MGRMRTLWADEIGFDCMCVCVCCAAVLCIVVSCCCCLSSVARCEWSVGRGRVNISGCVLNAKCHSILPGVCVVGQWSGLVGWLVGLGRGLVGLSLARRLVGLSLMYALPLFVRGWDHLSTGFQIEYFFAAID